MQKRYLGIDFGTKRIGLAISYASLAEPLEIVANNEDVFRRIREIVDREEITDLILGISESEMAEKTKEFAAELQEFLKLPIHFQDETLSTQHSRHNRADLRQKQGGSQSSTAMGQKERVDHLAAATILQEWLDEQMLK